MKLVNHNLIAVVGATATGKTRLAVNLAERFNGEVLSADSRQVYRGLDIGSGKDLHEYGAIPYHLIDIINPLQEYDLFHYQRDFYSAFENINQRGKSAILCGGSFLYIDAVLRGYELTEVPTDDRLRRHYQAFTTSELSSELLNKKPQLHNTTDLNDRERLIRALEICVYEEQNPQGSSNRPAIEPIVMAIDWSRPERTKRIKQRLSERLAEGMIAEVEQLHNAGVGWDKLHFFGLEYRFIAQHLQGEINFNDMQQKLASAIVKFAKRQDTWLRKLQRNGIQIHFLDPSQDLMTQALSIIQSVDS